MVSLLDSPLRLYHDLSRGIPDNEDDMKRDADDIGHTAEHRLKTGRVEPAEPSDFGLGVIR